MTDGQNEALGPLPVGLFPPQGSQILPPVCSLAPRAATVWGLGRAPHPVSCPMEGICLQLWPCLLRSWGPGSQRSSALEELSPDGEPREPRGPRGHRAQPAGKGELRGRGPKAASGHQGPPGSTQGDGEWGWVVESGGWRRPRSPPSSQGSVPPPAEAAAPAASLCPQRAIRWGWSPRVGTLGLSSSRPLLSLWKPPDPHTGTLRFQLAWGSSFNQNQWFCLKQDLGAGQHHAAKRPVRHSCS